MLDVEVDVPLRPTGLTRNLAYLIDACISALSFWIEAQTVDQEDSMCDIICVVAHRPHRRLHKPFWSLLCRHL